MTKTLTESQAEAITRFARGGYLEIAVSIVRRVGDGFEKIEKIEPGCFIVAEDACSYKICEVQPDMTLASMEVQYE